MLHSAGGAGGGGALTVTGQTTITNPGQGGIDIQDSTTAISFANVNVTGSGLTGVFVDDSTGSISFGDLDINPDAAQRGLHITDHATGTISSTSGNITTTTGTAVEITGAGTTPLNMVLTLVSVSGAPSGIVVQNNSGSLSVIGDNTNARNGSGGIMTNTTSDAVRLTNGNNITLKSINMNSPGDTIDPDLADNEGTVGEHGVEAIGGSNIILSGVLIDGPSASGMIAINVTGTNRINNNSLVTNIDNPATHGLYITNATGSNLTLFEVNDTDFTNSSSGAANINFRNSGTANMTVEIRNGCIFEALSSQAVTADAGLTAGTTGTVTSLITGNTFRNAVGVAENNVAALVANGATHNSTISNNLLENIARDGTIANTSIIRTQNSGGKLTSVVSGNTIQNIAYAGGSGGRHVIGHVFEPAAFTAGNFSDLNFNNNTATNITYTGANRAFMFIDYREFASGGDIKILDNNWNMPTDSGSDEAVELRFRQRNASTVDVLVDDNGTGTGAIHRTTSRFFRVDAEESANVNLTVTDNIFTNQTAGVPGTAIDLSTEDSGAAVGGPPTMCVNITGNNVTAAGNTIRLNEAQGQMNVTQASAAAVTAANTGAAVTVVGTPAFGQPACALPVNALLTTPDSNWTGEAVATATAEKDYSSVVAAATGEQTEAQIVKPAASSAQSSVATAVPNAVRRHSHHAVSKIKRAFEAVTNLRSSTAPMMLSGETVTVDGSGAGFTLPAGRTITIKFRVTVDNPPNLPAAQLNPARVINQGTVSGSNFASVLTDDTAVVGPANPTETLIDLFESQTSVITSDSSIIEGDSVTFTATVTPVSAGPTPVTGTVDFFDGALPGGTLIAGCDDRPLSGNPATATCTTTALTAAGSPHTITARYNADGGNYDQSTGTVSQTVILVPDLTINKAHVGTFFQGQTGAQYTITVTNNGGGAMPAGETITVTETLPDGLTATAISGTNWTCADPLPATGPAVLTCTRSGANSALASLASYPVITLTVNVDADATVGTPGVTNSVSVTSGAGGEVNTGNNSDTDPTDINEGIDLTIDKNHTDIFTQGDTGKTYTITVTNVGGTPTSGTVTVTDTLPTGLTPTAPNGAHNGWTCGIVGQVLTCTRNDALAATASYPDITLTVDVAANAPPSVDNTATVSGGGDIVPGNNSDTDQTNIAQNCITPPAGMVAWWTGDDTPRDIAGGNDGTLNGNAGYAAGKVLNGFNLDGTGDFVEAPDSASLDLTTSITIDAWINPTNAATTARLVDKVTTGNTDGYVLDLNAGKLRFTAGAATAESTGVIPAATLTHVAVTYDGANISFYINGVLDSTTAATGAIPTNALPLRIGAAQDGTLAFTGVIDEVEIFNTALLVADILAIHNSGVGGKCKPSDLTISKTHTDPFQQGSTGNTYTITVTNDGPGDTTGTTTVTDTLPAGLTATAMTGTGWTCQPTAPPNTFPVAGPTTLACTSTDVVAAGADFPVITLTVDVGANTPSVTNTVTVSGGGEMDTSDDSDSDLTNLNAQADLQIVSKTELADPVIASQNITYSISFINNGPSDASTVTITDAVPAGTTFVSASITTGTGWIVQSQPSVGGTGNVIFAKGTVAVGDTATFQVVVNTNANLAEGTLVSNTATAASSTSDPVANNSGSASTTVNQSDIEITSKTDTPDPVNAGDNITYTIDFKNNSAVNSSSTVTVTDTVPTGTTLVSATTASPGWARTDALNAGDTGDVVFSKATVAASETAQFTIVVKVNSNVASTTVISNTATAATASIDTNTPNNSKTTTTTVATSADLEINSKADSPDPVTAGQNITYTINFTNNGPSDAAGVTVTDTVPTGTTLVSAGVTASLSAGWSRTDSVPAGGTGDVVFSNSSVPDGATAEFQIIVKVNSNVTTQISNTATAAATTTDPNGANNSKTALTNTQASADVELTAKNDSPDPVIVGTNLTYTINFVNNGPSDAVTVTVSDPLPVGTTLVSATTGDAGWARTDATAVGANGTIEFSNASVPAGATATFTIVVLVDAGLADGTLLNNTATAASPTDSTAGNNSASSQTTVTTTLALTVNTTGDQADANVGDRICDVDLGTGGDQCTLRAAIQETNAAATADTINFSLPADSTITLSSALPAIAGDLDITGPTNGLTIDGNNNSRVFSVSSGTVTIDPMSIVGGRVTGGHGAALLVTGGDVTVKDLLFTSNTAVNGNGGALAVTGGLLTVLNTTISGNTATNGGGVYNGGGGLTMVNVTVTNNNANGDNGGGPGSTTGEGGGVHVGANPTLVQNSIIALNTAITGSPNVSGSIGLGGTNITAGDPRLAPLANNGGPTQTHALLAGSPALDAGTDAHATAAGLTNDQRGPGFTRFADGPDGDATPTVDIGAFEAQVWVEDIADRSIDEDSSDSFNFSVGGIAAITSVTATSSNTALVPNNIANLNVTGAGGTRTLTITPVADGFGTTTITVTVNSASGSMSDTFLFTVNGVNDPPSFIGGPDQTVNEDAGAQTVGGWATAISQGPNESGQTLEFLISNNNNGLFSVQPAIAPNGTLTYTPAPGGSGVATVFVQLRDDGGGADTSPIPPDQFTITVNAINDAPVLDNTGNMSLTAINEDIAPASNTGTLVSAIIASAGGDRITDADAGALEGIAVANVNNANGTWEFSTNGGASWTPFGSPTTAAARLLAANGTTRVRFLPNANFNGTVNPGITFRAWDQTQGVNGGTAALGAGGNASAFSTAGETASITVNAVNDAPTANAQNVNTNEDTALGITLTGTDVETTSANLTFNITTGPANGVLSGTGANRTYTPNANYNGPDSFSFTVTDTGDGSSPALTSAAATVSITVNAVNDGPVNTVPGAQSVTENSTLTFSAGNGNLISIADVDAGAPGVRVTLTGTNGTVTLSGTGGLAFTVGDGTADATMTFSGTVANINTALNGLVFTPTAGFDGAASLQIVTNDLGNTGSGGALSDTDTVNITVNDGGALAFSAATYSVNEIDGSATITVNRTGGTAGTATVDFATTTGGTATAGSDYTTTTGTLTFGPGVTSQTFNVPITNDPNNEANETVNLTLSNVTGSGSLGAQSTAVLTIVDNDPGGALQFSSATYTVGESAGSIIITVDRIGGSNGTAFVDFATSPGTATAGSDYTTTSGTLTFGNGVTSQTFSVPILADTDDESDETVNLTLSNVSGTGSLGIPSTAVLTITDNDPPTFSLDASSYSVGEGDLRITATVNRGGDLSQAVRVNYATSDPSGLNECSQITGNASQRCDYATVVGTLRFAAGESSKLIHIPIVDDVYVEGAETFTLTLSNATGGTLGTPVTATATINDNDVGPAANPIDNDAFWLRQMYIDILGREPEPGAINAWLAILNQCANPTDCDRTAVALGFLRSVEFQGRGFFAYRFYAASLGRPSLYSEFVPDHARFSGFLNPAELELNKQDYVNEFMNRAEFKTIYDPTIGNNTAYVDTLLQRAGLPNHPQRQGWIDGLNNTTLTRGDVLRQLVDSNEVYFRFLNEGFVVMNYFGLLRRSADAQYLVWIQILNQTGDDRVVVTGFINSTEYRLRFGPN